MDKKIKLAILGAVIMLLLILLILNALYPPIMVVSCVSNPLGEMTSAILRAQETTTPSQTQLLCLGGPGDFIYSEAILNRLSNVRELSLECETSICASKLNVTNEGLETLSKVRFKVEAQCEKVPQGGYDCVLTVTEAMGDKYIITSLFIIMELILIIPLVLVVFYFIKTLRTPEPK